METVGRYKKVIEEYILNQLGEDKNYEQLTMKELLDPRLPSFALQSTIVEQRVPHSIASRRRAKFFRHSPTLDVQRYR